MNTTYVGVFQEYRLWSQKHIQIGSELRFCRFPATERPTEAQQWPSKALENLADTWAMAKAPFVKPGSPL